MDIITEVSDKFKEIHDTLLFAHNDHQRLMQAHIKADKISMKVLKLMRKHGQNKRRHATLQNRYENLRAAATRYMTRAMALHVLMADVEAQADRLLRSESNDRD